ncbi:hypothetical protein C8J57DRAFT_1515882 [Mycena rebaudengoi]|nr:hypothetical protein C8J57DRAFT_1515882 [Mycena rebaudengoi]
MLRSRHATKFYASQESIPTDDCMYAQLHSTGTCSIFSSRARRRWAAPRRAAARKNGGSTLARSVRLLSDTSANRSATARRRTKLLAARNSCARWGVDAAERASVGVFACRRGAMRPKTVCLGIVRWA